MEDGPVVKVSKRCDGKVSVIQINRIKSKNAVDYHTATLLHDAFMDFEKDKDSMVAVLYGGEDTFCSGADLKAISNGTRNNTEEEGIGPMGPTRLRLSKPVIAAIAGYAVAGGLELACWCDLRVAKSNAIFGVFCRRWGVPLIDGGTVRLPLLIGLSRAMDMILTGREVTAKEAYDMGLVNRIVEESSVLDAAVNLAESIAKFPQICMRHDRMSTLDNLYGIDEISKMMAELKHGRHSLDKETLHGATRFAKDGRHGAFETIRSKL